MVDFGFRAHDFGKCGNASVLAQKAASFRKNSCLHLAPYKVFDSVPKPLTEEWANETKIAFDKEEVRTAILGVYINPVHPDLEKEEAALKSFENGLEIAKFLGNPIVATETGSIDPANVRCEETWSDSCFSRFLKNIERLLNCAVKNNTVMAIEAVSDKNTIDNPQRMLKVMEEFKCKNLRVLFDAVNILPIKGIENYETWYSEALDMLSPYICAMHIKDFNWVDSSKEYPYAKGPVKNGNLPVGEGLMPWKSIMNLYKKYNLINVPMTLENFNPATLDKSLSFIQSCV